MKKRGLALLMAVAVTVVLLPTACAAEPVVLEAPIGLTWDDTGTETQLTWSLDEVAAEQMRYVEIELYYSETVSDAVTTEGLTRLGEPFGKLQRMMATGALTNASVFRGLSGHGGADNGYYYAQVRVLPGWQPGDAYGPSDWSELSPAYHLVRTLSPEYAALPKLPVPSELVWNKVGLEELTDRLGYMAWKRNAKVRLSSVRVYRRNEGGGSTMLMRTWTGGTPGGGGSVGDIPPYDFKAFPDEMLDPDVGGYRPGTYFFKVQNWAIHSDYSGYQDSDWAVSPDWTYIAPLGEEMFQVDTEEEAYTGSTVTKTVTSKLILGEDYTVTYQDNVEPGQATLTIQGMGNYTGELVYSFVIARVQTGSMEGTDRGLDWTCSETGRVAVSGELADEEMVLVGCYDNQGKLTELKQLTRDEMTAKMKSGTDRIKLFWLGAAQKPQSASVTVWGK